MKSIITLVLILVSLHSYAQDIIKIKNQSPINCKITGVTNDDIYFIKDSASKKVPKFLVEYFEYNKTIAEEVVTPQHKEHKDSVQSSVAFKIQNGNGNINKAFLKASGKSLKLSATYIALTFITSLSGVTLLYALKSPETIYVTSGLSLVFAILSVTELHKAGVQLENAADN